MYNILLHTSLMLCAIQANTDMHMATISYFSQTPFKTYTYSFLEFNFTFRQSILQIYYY